jgi:hypothetical protein
MLVLVMLVRPFVSRVFLFFVVALLVCILEIEICVHIQLKVYSVGSSQWWQSLYLNMIVNEHLQGWIVFREPVVFVYLCY